MSSIDTRVVEAQFKNDQFKQGVGDTISSLDKLKGSLNMEGSAKGLQEVNAAAAKFDSNPMESGAGRIAGAFTAMQATVFGAFASIGAKAVAVGSQVISSFTIDPVKAGFDEYELKMGSIQTILANTQRHGTGLETVNAELEKLNEYADGTIYNFGDMTKNIGLFTNAGIKVEDATSMIKGFSNAAASSGTSAEGAASAAYQMSQALSTGTIRAQDWISLTNVGMGNKNMQESLVGIADAMGTFKGTTITADDAVKDVKGTLEKGWLTADVMSKYLQIMSGDMDDASIAALGLSDAQVKMLRQQQQTGFDAATKVRTFSQMMGTLKEAVGSGWSESFGIVVGDFNEATDLFTSLNNSIGGWLGSFAKSRNEMLQGWKDLGGRTVLLDGLKEAFWLIAAPLAQIGQAFRQLFPKSTAQDLFNMTQTFTELMHELQPTPETLDRIQRTFAGLFAVVHIGWTIIKGLANFIGDLILGLGEGDSGILKFTASIGDFLVGLDKAITAGGGVTTFFDNLRDLIFKIINPLRDAGSAFGDILNGVQFDLGGSALGQLITGFLSLGAASATAVTPIDRAKGALEGIKGFAGKVAGWVGDIARAIAGVFDGWNYDDIMQGLQVGMMGGLVGVLAQLGSALKGFNIFGGKGNGIFAALNDSLSSLSGTLKSMQNDNNASALMKLAGAIAILALAVVILAAVDPVALTKAAIALGVLFAQLTIGMGQLSKAVGIMGAAKLNLLIPALIGISIAILLLVGAVYLLSQMSWEELAKGMGALAAMLILISASVKIMSSNTKGMFSAAAGILLIAIAINLLVFAVKQFADMSWEEMAQGFTGVAALLIALALFTKFQKAGVNAVAQGASIALLAGAIYVLAQAVKTLGSMSWDDMLRGLAGMDIALASIVILMKGIGKDPKIIFAALAVAHIAGALGLIADVFMRMASLSWGEVVRGMLAFAVAFGMVILAIKAVEKVNFAQLAGLSLVTDALMQMAEALSIMGSMSWEEIQRGLGGLVGAIGVLTVALLILQKVPANAGLSLGLVAGSLALLAPALATMAAIPIVGIVSALVLLAGVFLILWGASVVLAGAVPVLLGLGIAIALIGAAVFLAGAGIAALAVGLLLLGTLGAVATAGIVAIVSALLGLLPVVAEQIMLAAGVVLDGLKALVPKVIEILVLLLSGLIQGLITLIPQAVDLIVTLLTELMAAIVELTPQVVATLLVMLAGLLFALEQAIPMMVVAGINVLAGILTGIAQNISRIVTIAATIIVNFLNGIAMNLPRIIDAGIKLIISFVNGLAEGIRNNSQAMSDAGINLAKAIVEGMVKGIGNGAGAVIDAAKNLAKGAFQAAKDFLHINSPSKIFITLGESVGEGFVVGIDKGRDAVEKSAQNMAQKAKDAAESAANDAAKAAEQIQKLTKARDDDNLAIEKAQRDLQKAQSAKKVDANRVTDLRIRIQQLTEKRDADNQAIRDATVAMNEANSERERASSAYKYITENMVEEKNKLEGLADTYDSLTERIKDANKALEDAEKTRDDYSNSIRDKYDDLPDISNETKLSNFVADLKKQIEDTKQFTTAVQKLRAMGLNDDLYRELLDKGPSALPFVNELVAGGRDKVSELNSLQTSLEDAASGLGQSASTALYQAAVDSAAGLVQGLQDQQAAVKAQMDAMAAAMVQAVKDRLGIQSPSTVMAEQGDYATQGLVQGIMGAAPTVTQAGFDIVAVLLKAVTDAILLSTPGFMAQGTSVGIAIDNGIVQGINAGSGAIQAAAYSAAMAALDAAKMALGIASPSKEFTKLGQWSSEGMAIGIGNYSGMVADAASSVGSDAVLAMSKSIAGLGDMVLGDADMNPVITPVLDLSSVSRDAGLMSSMLETQPLSVDASYSTAARASAKYWANQDAETSTEAPVPVSKSVTLIQNNNSPKALSTATIYRNTNNQLSRVKGALND